MIHPRIDELLENVDSRYALVIVAAKRARQINDYHHQLGEGIGFDQAESEAFSHTSIKEYVTPQQIADQILYLASPRARTISGQAISICGDTGMLG